jgi:hypothetical protein
VLLRMMELRMMELRMMELRMMELRMKMGKSNFFRQKSIV